MSATDPVAVVSILKSAGASPKLTTLIIGESLMNDGTAMIFFSLFFGMVEGHNYSAGQIAAYMFQMTLGIKPYIVIRSHRIILHVVVGC